MFQNFENIKTIKLKDTSYADQLLQTLKRSTVLIAQEAGIDLYKSNGAYNLPVLKTTRGDLASAILNENILALYDYNLDKIIAFAYLISDKEVQKSLIYIYDFNPDYRNKGLEKKFFNGISKYLKAHNIEEVYIYIPNRNDYLVDLMQKNKFLPFSVNSGRPYPRACFIRRLYRETK